MPRKILFLLLFASISYFLSAQSYYDTIIGKKARDIYFEHLLNSKQKSIHLSDLKGKMVILEFWATWCAPCIAAMPHMEALQKKFGKKIQIIAVNDVETHRKVATFVKNSKTNIWFAIDSVKSAGTVFPYRTIPHTVVIDADGITRAVTTPDNITEDVLLQIMAKKPVSLPPVSYLTDAELNNKTNSIFKDHYPTDYVFNLQPKIDFFGGASFSGGFGEFKDRRLSFMNANLLVIFREIYNWPTFRYIDKTTFPKENKNNANTPYCLDIIIPNANKDSLHAYAKRQIHVAFPEYIIKIEKKKVKVAVFHATDSVKQLLIPSDKPRRYKDGYTKVNVYNMEGVTINEFISTMEGFGLLRRLNVDETGLTEKYDINFSYDVGAPNAIENALRKIGLYYTIEEREVEFMVLYNE